MDQPDICAHLRAIKEIKVATEHVCEECVKHGWDWLHLRTCQTCGATLCCDSSPHKHMTKHFHATGHPVASSAEEGERWLWCYADEVMADY